MNAGKPQETIIIEVNGMGDLDKMASLELNLMLPQCQAKKRKHKRTYITEPVLVHELPVKIHKVIPVKEAKVNVDSITINLIQTQKSQDYF